MDNLNQQLKRLKAIVPDRGVMARSRAAILTERQKMPLGILVSSFFSRPVAIGAGVFAAIVAAIALTHPFTQAPVVSSLENTQALTQELNDLTINIQLQDISYQNEANQTVAAAITEIADTKTNHLNTGVLKSEQKSAEPSGNTNPEIDNLLNTIIL